MATVTGYTAEHMQEIEDATIVSAAIDGSGHLILTKHDGSTVDAGAVHADLALLPSSQVIAWNSDTNLYRSAANELKTDDAFVSETSISIRASSDSVPRIKLGTTKIDFSSGSAASDTTLYRNSAGELKTDGNLTVVGAIDAASLAIHKASGTDVVFTDKVNGDSNNRFQIEASGRLSWGSGSATPDVKLYRSSDGVLKADGTIFSDFFHTEHASAFSTPIITTRVSGETLDSFGITADGSMQWGNGSSAPDIKLYRDNGDVLVLEGELQTDRDIITEGDIVTFDEVFAQYSMHVGEGNSDSRMGTAVLVAGSKVVNTTAVSSTSRIFVFCQIPGGTPGFLRISARTSGTSFTITSSSGTDTSTVAWIIFEPF